MMAAREDARVLVHKTLCSCFLAIDGTITLRREMVPDAARAIASCLASRGLVQSSVDVCRIETVICAFWPSNGEKPVPVSAKVSVVADRICEAMQRLPLAA